MFDLTQLDLSDMVKVGATLRSIGASARTMEDVAVAATRYLYENLGDDAGRRACALVRFFKTHAYGELPPALRSAADVHLDGQSVRPETRDRKSVV